MGSAVLVGRKPAVERPQGQEKEESRHAGRDDYSKGPRPARLARTATGSHDLEENDSEDAGEAIDLGEARERERDSRELEERREVEPCAEEDERDQVDVECGDST